VEVLVEEGGVRYVLRQCGNAHCRFRFPADGVSGQGAVCPKCGAATAVAPLPAKSAWATAVTHPPPAAIHLELLLDNIRSLYNVGSIFRTADGVGVRHLHLGGISATPEHPKLAKTALGAHSVMGWSYWRNGWDTAVQLKEAGYVIWALEDAPNAISIYHLPPLMPAQPVLLVVGNENMGVDPAILALADQVLALPMRGMKDSLNVAVATGIALYQLVYGRGRGGDKETGRTGD
jgi:tRNA G18 (ribose-2'-O)-methylase SpoU